MQNKMSAEIDQIAPALLAAQIAIKGAKKDAVNPHLKNKYADLASVFDACKAELNENGIAIMQVMGVRDGRNVLITTLVHASGQYFSSEALLPDIDQRGVNAAQAMGSAISYMRRYQLQSIAGIIQEDDDGNAAGKPKEAEKPATKEPEAKPPLTFDEMLEKMETSDNLFHMKKRWENPQFIAGFALLSDEQKAEVTQKKKDMKVFHELSSKPKSDLEKDAERGEGDNG